MQSEKGVASGNVEGYLLPFSVAPQSESSGTIIPSTKKSSTIPAQFLITEKDQIWVQYSDGRL